MLALKPVRLRERLIRGPCDRGRVVANCGEHRTARGDVMRASQEPRTTGGTVGRSSAQAGTTGEGIESGSARAVDGRAPGKLGHLVCGWGHVGQRKRNWIRRASDGNHFCRQWNVGDVRRL